MYKVKSKGPKTEPCGTPHDVGNISEKQLPILMACCLSVRYEVNQLRAVPDMPYHVDRRVMRILWSMVSKAADRSNMLYTTYIIQRYTGRNRCLEMGDLRVLGILEKRSRLTK